jgi:hypothetical protein
MAKPEIDIRFKVDATNLLKALRKFENAAKELNGAGIRLYSVKPKWWQIWKK